MTPARSDATFKGIKEQQGGVDRGAADRLTASCQASGGVAPPSRSFAMLSGFYATQPARRCHREEPEPRRIRR